MEKIGHHLSEEQFMFHYRKFEKSPDIELHLHNSYEIYYFIEGDVQYHVEGQLYNLSKHDVLITNNRELHKPIFNSNCAYGRKLIQFKPSFLSGLTDEGYELFSAFENRKLGTLNQIEGELVKAYQIDMLFIHIEEAMVQKNLENRLMVKSYLLQMLIQFNRIHKKMKKETTQKIENSPKTLETLEYINAHLNEEISLEQLAQRLYMNKYHMCHLFKENTGFSVNAYITYKRIVWAKELLSSGISLMDACFTVGFRDYSSFYRAFMKLTGKSPKHFVMPKS